MRFISWIVCHLPRPLAELLATVWGALLFHVFRARRRVARENIRRALPELDVRARRHILRQSYDHLGHVLMTTLRLPVLSRDEAIAILGAARGKLDALRRRRGVVIAVGHLGLWDLLACAAGLAGLPLNVVTRRIKSRGIDRFWRRLRERCELRLIEAEGSALSIRRALGRGELVALAIDQHHPGGVAVPFFGRLAATTDAPARLAVDSGAPLVLVSLLRQKEGVALELRGPLAVELDPRDEVLTRADRVAALTRRLNALLEAEVRACPAQWFWVHRRWKIDDGA